MKLALRVVATFAASKGNKHSEHHQPAQPKAAMAFGHKKEGLYLRPRVRRTTPLMDIAFAIVIGGASGVYIFNDSMRRWQQTELELAEGSSASTSRAIAGDAVVSAAKESSQ